MMTSEERIGARLFSKTRAVGLSKPTVLHVRKLVEQHASCLSDLNRDPTRWKTFWSRISQVERNVLRLIVEAHGERIHEEELPVTRYQLDLFICNKFGNYSDLHTLTAEVEKELRMVLTDHYWSLVSTDELQEHMSKCQPMTMALLLSLDGFNNVLRECGLHADLVAIRYQDLLQAVGWDVAGAKALAQQFSNALQSLLDKKGSQA